MKKYFFQLLLLIGSAVSAQNSNWGTGLPITVVPNGSSLDISVFDPVLNYNVVTSIYTGSGQIYSNSDGVVVGYGGSTNMEFATYDWDLHTWKTGTLYLGSSNAKILTNDGVVAGYGSNSNMSFAIYDVNLHSWKTGTEYLGSTDDTLTLSDGIVAGYGSNSNMSYAIYDVQLQTWKTGTMYLGSTDAMMVNADGVVAGYGSNSNLSFATYDIELQTWKTGTSYLGSSNATIATQDGLVAGYGSSSNLEYAVYDFESGSWKTGSAYLGNTGSFTVSSGTISYNGSSSGAGTKGYSFSSSGWNSSPTIPHCKMLPYGILHSSWVRMRCMSFGAGTFTYSCGDGHQIYRKEGWKKYDLNNSYNAVLNVTNGVSNSSCDALIDITSGVEEFNSYMFTSYPNPSSGEMKILFAHKVSGELYVINYLGQTIFKCSIKNEDQFDFNINEDGMFVIQFVNDEKVYKEKVEIVKYEK